MINSESIIQLVTLSDVIRLIRALVKPIISRVGFASLYLPYTLHLIK